VRYIVLLLVRECRRLASMNWAAQCELMSSDSSSTGRATEGYGQYSVCARPTVLAVTMAVFGTLKCTTLRSSRCVSLAQDAPFLHQYSFSTRTLSAPPPDGRAPLVPIVS